MKKKGKERSKVFPHPQNEERGESWISYKIRIEKEFQQRRSEMNSDSNKNRNRKKHRRERGRERRAGRTGEGERERELGDHTRESKEIELIHQRLPDLIFPEGSENFFPTLRHLFHFHINGMNGSPRPLLAKLATLWTDIDYW